MSMHRTPTVRSALPSIPVVPEPAVAPPAPALEEVLRALAHDLRSTMGAIQNYATVLSEAYGRNLDDDGRQVLGRVSGAVRHGVMLLDELAGCTRVAKQPPRRAAVDMQALARSADERVRAAAAEALAPIRVEALPVAHSDEALLQVVWVRLLLEARAAGPGAAADIVVDARRSDGQVTYRVCSTGGPQRLALDGSVGLGVAGHMLRLVGGRLWIETDAGPGTRLCFTLPAD